MSRPGRGFGWWCLGISTSLSSPDALVSAELAPSPGEHRSRREGCRASQGRFPPPLWIRGYAVGRYARHPTNNGSLRAPPRGSAATTRAVDAASGDPRPGVAGLCQPRAARRFTGRRLAVDSSPVQPCPWTPSAIAVSATFASGYFVSSAAGAGACSVGSGLARCPILPAAR